jgi:plasmid stabilization system protein ParE
VRRDGGSSDCDEARLAARQPRAGRVVPEVGREDVREVLVGNYRIVYEVRSAEIRILTVFEGHRSLLQGAVPPAESFDEDENDR